jgi:hypothetical protein
MSALASCACKWKQVVKKQCEKPPFSPYKTHPKKTTNVRQ